MLRRQLLLQLATSLVAVVPAAHPLLQKKLHSGRITSDDSHDIVGVWFVNAVGAPFEPHLFTYHADGTMLTANPDAGDSHTSDSDGMGPWAHKVGNTFTGAFEEINADRTTHQFVSRLRVEYTITLSGDTFTGPATANYYNPDGSLQQGPFPATLNGKRINLPQ